MRYEKNIELLKGLMEKRKKTEDLLSQLQRSLTIQSMVPDAFEEGPCYASFVSDGNDVVFQIRKGTVLTGKTITFPFDKVPQLIIDDEIERRELTGEPHKDRRKSADKVTKRLSDYLWNKKREAFMERRREKVEAK
jgi:hypothetical protein